MREHRRTVDNPEEVASCFNNFIAYDIAKSHLNKTIHIKKVRYAWNKLIVSYLIIVS